MAMRTTLVCWVEVLQCWPHIYSCFLVKKFTWLFRNSNGVRNTGWNIWEWSRRRNCKCRCHAMWLTGTVWCVSTDALKIQKVCDARHVSGISAGKVICCQPNAPHQSITPRPGSVWDSEPLNRCHRVWFCSTPDVEVPVESYWINSAGTFFISNAKKYFFKKWLFPPKSVHLLPPASMLGLRHASHKTCLRNLRIFETDYCQWWRSGRKKSYFVFSLPLRNFFLWCVVLWFSDSVFQVLSLPLILETRVS